MRLDRWQREEQERLMQKESHRCHLCLNFSLMAFPITETVICCKRFQTAGKGRMERGNWWQWWVVGAASHEI